MAISSPGVGSGLELGNLIDRLMAVQRRPLTILAAREASAQSKISAFGQMNSMISSLQTAANGLKDAAKFAATRATVGSDAGFTATSRAGATTGNYAVEVKQLAQAQRVALSASGALTEPGDPTRIAAGTLSIGFGTQAQLDDGAPASSTVLNFAGGSLNDLRDAINDGDLGLRASVINDGSVQRLVISGADTGAEKAFTLQGLGFDFNPSAPGAEGDEVFQLQGAQNALLKVDGLSITRSGNTIDDVIEGVTLTLTRENEGTTSTLTIANDRSAARSAIDAFVQAYNTAVTGLRALTNFNSETNQGSALTGDSTARSIQNQLRNIVGGALEGLGATSRLSDIGITFQLNGTLSVDGTKLNEALNDPERDVASFFTGSEDVEGFAATVSTALGSFLGSTGLIAGRTDGLKSSIKSIDNQREALSRRLESTEQRLITQFTALDALVTSLNQTSNFLTQQLANLPGARKD